VQHNTSRNEEKINLVVRIPKPKGSDTPKSTCIHTKNYSYRVGTCGVKERKDRNHKYEPSLLGEINYVKSPGNIIVQEMEGSGGLLDEEGSDQRKDTKESGLSAERNGTVARGSGRSGAGGIGTGATVRTSRRRRGGQGSSSRRSGSACGRSRGRRRSRLSDVESGRLSKDAVEFSRVLH